MIIVYSRMIKRREILNLDSGCSIGPLVTVVGVVLVVVVVVSPTHSGVVNETNTRGYIGLYQYVYIY